MTVSVHVGAYMLRFEPVLNAALGMHRLPVDLHRELELPRIVSCRRLTGVSEQRADGRDVHLICDVKDVSNQVHVDVLSDVQSTRNADVVEHRPWRDAGIAAEIAIELQERRNNAGRYESINTRLLEMAGWREL